MDNHLFKKPETPDLSNSDIQRFFIEDAHSKRELIQKEIEINQVEQVLIGKRIQMMEGFANELPSTDPQYSMLLAQIQMDRIELDELKIREKSLSEQLTKKGL